MHIFFRTAAFHLLRFTSILTKLGNNAQTFLLYRLISTRAVISQFSGPYSPVGPAKI